ncbi:unnamed protein product [Oikopleura dioica]|uniref:G-protein coupled receptors family 1 profile domain-containing protein n=1 Tax=Oikopleura dioica TaxID=34765 RepID=E4XAV7_OIKDI|nr:unnamed protein product [Oikopleura dioica]CBY37747.1 unnamed protein product [Oikopleura dioica]
MSDAHQANSTSKTFQRLHPEWFFNLVGALYMIIFTVGAFGNIIVIYGFKSNKKLRQQSESNKYIWHLAITDLIFVCTLPFFAVDYFYRHVWIFGTYWCKVCRYVSKVNMYSSIFFLTALSVDRMIAVTRPTSHLWIRKAKGIFATSIAIWCSSLAMAIPEAIYSTDTWSSVNHTICGMSFPKNSSSQASVTRWYNLMGMYELTKCIFGFFGPICIILYSYAAILYTVQWKLIGSKDGKSRATKLAFLIVLTFIICWLPFQALSLQSALGGFLDVMEMSDAAHAFFRKAMPYAIFLAYSNSALNPILYAFTLRPFRDGFSAGKSFWLRQKSEKQKLLTPPAKTPKLLNGSSINHCTSMHTNSTSLTTEAKSNSIKRTV